MKVERRSSQDNDSNLTSSFLSRVVDPLLLDDGVKELVVLRRRAG